MTKVGIVGDSHCPVMVDGYAEWCMDVFDQWGVERIVHIGDLTDQHSASMHANEIGFYDIVSEMEAAREQVSHMAEVFGDKVEVLQGNHDSNLGRKMKLVGLDPALLRTPEDIWDVKWKFYPRYHKLIIDDVIYMHGDQGRGGRTPSLAKAEGEWMSVVAGHHHSAGGVWWGCNENTRYFGLSVGCGVNHKHAVMAYGASFAMKPMLGCGVVIDGTPYFEPMPLANKYGRK
jgi:predicted phosphodiesterase